MKARGLVSHIFQAKTKTPEAKASGVFFNPKILR